MIPDTEPTCQHPVYYQDARLNRYCPICGHQPDKGDDRG